MSENIKTPKIADLIQPSYEALKILGGSGTNDEIHDEVVRILSLPDEVVDTPHLGSITQSELQYNLAWVRTYLSKYGAIINSARSVWSITTEFSDVASVDSKDVISVYMSKRGKNDKPSHNVVNQTVNATIMSSLLNEEMNTSNENTFWRNRLSIILQEMNPYAFERLTQRLLRECGFSQVEVTKKSGDGGIDGVGKLRINGIVCFNVAFQCKRYSGQVSAPEIRQFRGSLPNSIEKGVFITTGTFTKAAKEEAASFAKQQIDLMDGEELMNKLAEYELGLAEVKDYEIDEEFFSKI